MACWFSRRTLNQRLSIHPINTTYPLKSKQQAAAEHVVFILESELAITYSDWRASIRHFKTLCNWCLSADCLWICSAQINTAQLYVCIAVIVMESGGGGGKVTETPWFLDFSQAPLLWGPLNCTHVADLRMSTACISCCEFKNVSSNYVFSVGLQLMISFIIKQLFFVCLI